MDSDIEFPKLLSILGWKIGTTDEFCHVMNDKRSNLYKPPLHTHPAFTLGFYRKNRIPLSKNEMERDLSVLPANGSVRM